MNQLLQKWHPLRKKKIIKFVKTVNKIQKFIVLTKNKRNNHFVDSKGFRFIDNIRVIKNSLDVIQINAMQ